MRRAAFALTAFAALAGCFHAANGPSPPPAGGETVDFATLAVEFTPILDGLAAPVLVTHAGDGSGRLFVVEQEGVIRVARGGTLLPQPFLDIRDLVLAGGERGLLGLAFPPDFESSRVFFVDYTAKEGDGDTVIARYSVSDDPDRADPASATVLLVVDQPYANHNGGALAFGPDGFLYVGMGDGGSGGDPHNHAQRLDSLLGKILRLDVAGQETYRAPVSNPFVDEPGARPEVWAYGLRNPWRLSFDRATGDLWIGDVGQNRVEEIDYQPASSRGGENYGWRVWEGSHRYAVGEAPANAVFPVAEYAHEGSACSVTGGHVYRGATYAAMRGVYFFADYCTGEVSGVAPAGEAWATRSLGRADARVSSFGEDEAGELYVVDHGGRVLRVAPASLLPG